MVPKFFSAEAKKTIIRNVDISLTLTQVTGFTMVILSGFYHGLFRADMNYKDCEGNTGCLNLHGLLMTFGFVFFQGEALITFRLFRNEPKFLAKVAHIMYCLCTVVLFSIALTAVVKYKDANDQIHMYSFHSWIGIALITAFIIQMVFGFLYYVLPTMPEDDKDAFTPAHRYVGLCSFGVCILQALVGHVSLALDRDVVDSDEVSDSAYNTLPKRYLVLNFAVIMMVLYGAAVANFVAQPHWRRPKSE